MLSALRTSRGHDLGWIGLTVDGNGSLPDPASVRRRIDALAQTL
jgi:hypothetical protein